MWNYFANFGSKLTKNVSKSKSSEVKIWSNSPVQSFAMHNVTKNEKSCAIDSFKSNSSSGIDGISPKSIKMAKAILSPFLTKLYNKCLKQAYFPDLFKVSKIIPIPKLATTKELGEFRPTSLLNMFSKVFEKLIKDRMIKFIDKHCISSPKQFGFEINSSTELAITTIYDTFFDHLDKNLYTCAIFLDIK